jgi:Tetracyclin repressor-like, C-terminal domain
VELARELEGATLGAFRGQLSALLALPLEGAVRKVVHVLATEQLGAVAMRRELLRHVPRAWLEEVSSQTDAQVRALLAEHLRARSDVRHGDEIERAFVALHAVEAVVEASVLGNPAPIGSQQLLEELTQLVVRYLQP